MKTKRCPACKQSLPLSEFWKHKGMKDGLQPYCKKCWYAKTRVYQNAHRDHVLYLRRNGHLKRKYGITVEQLNEISRDGCHMCGDRERLHVDHDHRSNKIRGVLCHWCNILLGHAKEDTDRLKAAVVYLEKHQ